MNKTAKLILKIFTSLAILIVVCFGIIVVLFMTSDPNQYKQTISDQIKSQTGASLDIGGDLKVTFLPVPGVIMKDVRFVTPKTSMTNISAEAESVKMNFELMSFFGNEYRIKYFKAKGLNVAVLDKDKKVSRFVATTFSGELARTCCGVELPDFEITHQDTLISGYLKVQTDLKTPLIEGKIKVVGWQADAFQADYKATLPAPDRVIQPIELPFDLFEAVDWDLLVDLKKINYNSGVIPSGEFKLTSKEGKAEFFPFKLMIWDSELSGRVGLERTGPARGVVKVDLKTKDSDFEKLFDKDVDLSGGRFDLSFQGQGHGRHLHEVLSGWSGNALWYLKDTTIKNRTIKSDLTETFLGFINPFKEKEPTTKVDCAVMRLDIKKGTAYAINHIGAQTSKLDLLGTGKIDFSSEAIDMEFTLRKRRGIDIKLGNFDKYIRLSGNLAEPKIVPNPKGLLEDGLSLFGVLTSGGLSLVAEQVFDKIGKNESPCSAILNDA